MATKKSKKVQEEAQKTVSKKGAVKADAKKASKKKNSSNSKKNGKPGFFTRVKKYFSSVRSEMKRVTWPSKKELVNYSIAVIVSLLVVGIVIALLDMGIGEGLALFAGLRG